jgi:hypothetical protein
MIRDNEHVKSPQQFHVNAAYHFSFFRRELQTSLPQNS